MDNLGCTQNEEALGPGWPTDPVPLFFGSELLLALGMMGVLLFCFLPTWPLSEVSVGVEWLLQLAAFS